MVKLKNLKEHYILRSILIYKINTLVLYFTKKRVLTGFLDSYGSLCNKNIP